MEQRDDLSGVELYTIGHSTHDQHGFLELVSQFHITRIIDIRTFPGSKRFPQFNKDELAKWLAEAGVDYVHLGELGGRRKPRTDSPNTNWRNPSFRAYADFMETEEFKAGIDRLIALAREQTSAIMCAEAGWWRCHRALISDYLKLLGVKVIHILSKGKSEEHPFTSAASVEGTKLNYGGPPLLDVAPTSPPEQPGAG